MLKLSAMKTETAWSTEYESREKYLQNFTYAKWEKWWHKTKPTWWEMWWICSELFKSSWKWKRKAKDHKVRSWWGSGGRRKGIVECGDRHHWQEEGMSTGRLCWRGKWDRENALGLVRKSPVTLVDRQGQKAGYRYKEGHCTIVSCVILKNSFLSFRKCILELRKW